MVSIKSRAKDEEKKMTTKAVEEKTSEAEESSDGEEEEQQEPIPAPVVENADHEEEPKKFVPHMSKVEREAFYNTAELSNFSKEEDNAIKLQLNGEELVRTTGPTLIKEINHEVKNATPNWVSGKWVRNMKTAARNAKKREEHKKMKLA